MKKNLSYQTQKLPLIFEDSLATSRLSFLLHLLLSIYLILCFFFPFLKLLMFVFNYTNCVTEHPLQRDWTHSSLCNSKMLPIHPHLHQYNLVSIKLISEKWNLVAILIFTYLLVKLNMFYILISQEYLLLFICILFLLFAWRYLLLRRNTPFSYQQLSSNFNINIYYLSYLYYKYFLPHCQWTPFWWRIFSLFVKILSSHEYDYLQPSLNFLRVWNISFSILECIYSLASCLTMSNRQLNCWIIVS